MAKRKPPLIAGIPEAPVCGVYALIDDDGKRYIGSSKNIRRRMIQHNTYMNVCRRDGHSGFLNGDIEKAVNACHTFRCEVLASFACPMTPDELREIERVFIDKFGGCKATYNQLPINHKI